VPKEEMERHDEKMQLLASALYEIRLLLSNYLGSRNDADQGIREAAHLSYALHNEAQAVSRGDDFDLDAAIRRVEAIETILPGSKVSKRILGGRNAGNQTAQHDGGLKGFQP
jgi:hypothetical protein